jgi:transcriptional regulator with XRE-family HTH domain
MYHKLENYLRAHRKRSGLTQDDVAFLLGSRSGTKVSRYEQFRRLPTLPTALALEILFDVPGQDLFAGLYQEIERTLTRRAEDLIKRLRAEPPNRVTQRKLSSLRSVCLPRRKGRRE